MADYLDLEGWPRRDAYEHFRAFDQPFFSLCVRVDAAPLRARLEVLAEPGRRSLSLALHFIALRLANEHEPWRWRIEGERVRIHPQVDASTTVLREDDSFGIARLPHQPGHAAFCRQAAAAMAAARQRGSLFEDTVADTALIYFTTLPWLHFSSFSHARDRRRPDSIPRIAFGRIDPDGARAWLPVQIDVHHALMDGLHVGRWVQAFEAALAAPESWLAG